jgi:hypothetical protein
MASPYALDFSPVANALDGNRKYGLQLQDQELDRQRLALSQAAAGREAAMHPLRLKSAQAELAAKQQEAKERRMGRAVDFIHSQSDNFEKLAPEAKAQHWDTLLKSDFFDDDDRKRMFDDPVYGPLWKNPETGYRMLKGLTREHQLRRQKIEADVAKAGVTNLSPGEQAVDLKTGKVIASAPAKTGPLIKEGDKPLVIFEPDAEGRLQARTVHEGPQGNAVAGIAGGMRELHDIPNRYGGDKGVFGSAVGAFQGDPNSYVLGPLSRAWGSLSSFTASGAGSTAPPAEVRRAIEGATNTLAASLKPLIRKPGEGSWSDRDQAVLDSIVGNLTRANDVAQYDRELENVRSRIEQNFGVKLPALTRKPQADRLPASGQPAPTRSVAPNPSVQDGATATNPRTGQRIIFRNGQWQPL